MSGLICACVCVCACLIYIRIGVKIILAEQLFCKTCVIDGCAKERKVIIPGNLSLIATNFLSLFVSSDFIQMF